MEIKNKLVQVLLHCAESWWHQRVKSDSLPLRVWQLIWTNKIQTNGNNKIVFPSLCVLRYEVRCPAPVGVRRVILGKRSKCKDLSLSSVNSGAPVMLLCFCTQILYLLNVTSYTILHQTSCGSYERICSKYSQGLGIWDCLVKCYLTLLLLVYVYSLLLLLLHTGIPGDWNDQERFRR